MKNKRIQVFEHQTIYFDQIYSKILFEKKHYVALSKLNALHNNKYFTVLHNGICFKQFVGVIQIDNLTIEILPKIDNRTGDEQLWQSVLIEMLKVTKKLKIEKLENANVKKQQVYLLDIYFEWFLKEVKLLIHQGLIKQYYKETGNVKTLKGKLEFSAHIRQNLVHKERFYTTHQIYDKNHLIHQILSHTINIIEEVSKGSYLFHKCKTLKLDFPEVSQINVTAHTFSKIVMSRKTFPYETALSLARFIILNYAPNISNGNEKMLALLFNMNSLWEEYVLVRLKNHTTKYDINVSGQQTKELWNNVRIRPDIIITRNFEHKDFNYIIDTKWKNIDSSKPSTHDLRQMYVYNDYWIAEKSLLLYPSNKPKKCEFIKFENFGNKEDHHACAIGKINILNKDDSLKEDIGNEILELIFR